MYIYARKAQRNREHTCSLGFYWLLSISLLFSSSFGPHNKGLSSLAKHLAFGKVNTSLQPNAVHNEKQFTGLLQDMFVWIIMRFVKKFCVFMATLQSFILFKNKRNTIVCGRNCCVHGRNAHFRTIKTARPLLKILVLYFMIRSLDYHCVFWLNLGRLWCLDRRWMHLYGILFTGWWSSEISAKTLWHCPDMFFRHPARGWQFQYPHHFVYSSVAFTSVRQLRRAVLVACRVVHFSSNIQLHIKRRRWSPTKQYDHCRLFQFFMTFSTNVYDSMSSFFSHCEMLCLIAG